jgi:uracil-DNA glycosylase family 4
MGRIVKATGPVPCRYMIVAERPGKVEAQRGYCLCGPSGQELDRYLFVNAGISRDAVYCTNLVKDYRDDESPSEEEIQRDWPLLEEELHTVCPDYIVAMGLYSARAFLGPDIDMEVFNGCCFPRITRCPQCGQISGSGIELHRNYSSGLLGMDSRVLWPEESTADSMSSLCHCSNSEVPRKFSIMPIIHVAAGLHRPRYAAQIAWGFEQFGRMIKGEEMPSGHLRDIESNPLYKELESFIVKKGVVGMDTEGTVEAPWCLSASDMEGCGAVIRPGKRVDVSSSLTILHNSIHDLQVLDAMNVKLGEWTDTMTMASLLGTEPLGLKALARRHAGMVMSEYSEVVAPAARDLGLEYLGKVLEFAEANTNAESE